MIERQPVQFLRILSRLRETFRNAVQLTGSSFLAPIANACAYRVTKHSYRDFIARMTTTTFWVGVSLKPYT